MTSKLQEVYLELGIWREGAFPDSLEQQRNNIPMQAYPCSSPTHESI